MKLKIRKANKDGVVRVESSGEIKEVIINEDFFHPEEESISLCFRGKDSSGILDISTKEFDKLADAIQSRIHLIKGIKKVRE